MNTDIALVPLKQDTIAKLFTIRSSQDETLDGLIQRLANQESKPSQRGSSPRKAPSRGTYLITLLGERFTVSTLGEVLVAVLRELTNLDSEFLPRFSQEHGHTRRYVARKAEALYPGRPDLAHYHCEVKPGWFVGTNYSRRDVKRILRAACEVAGITFGEDLVLEFPSEKRTANEELLALFGFTEREDCGQ